VFSIEETEIEITETLQMIGLQCTFSEASVIGPSTDLETFRSDMTTKRVWLYRFTFKAGTNGNPGRASLDVVGKPPGNWEIGSEFAPQ
jgi:hypothetical protein